MIPPILDLATRPPVDFADLTDLLTQAYLRGKNDTLDAVEISQRTGPLRVECRVCRRVFEADTHALCACGSSQVVKV